MKYIIPIALTTILASSAAADFRGYTGPHNFAVNLSTNFATPHVKWAQPLPGGPVRALFVIHISGQPATNPRGVVELMQRFDLEAEVVYADARYSVICGEEAAAKGGAEGVKRLADLMKKEYDVFVFGNVSINILPDEIKRDILERVSNGAGLVAIGPGPFGPSRHGTIKEDPTRDRNPAPLLRPTGLAGLLEFSRGKVEPSLHIAGEIMWAYTQGKGRQALIQYATAAPIAFGSLTPELPFSWANLVKYEYWSAFVGRTILWAAGRDVSGGISQVPLDGAHLQAGTTGWQTALKLDKLEQGVEWEAAIRRMSDGYRIPAPTDTVQQDKTWLVNVELPRLMAGGYMIELRASDGKASRGFACVPFSIGADVSVDISLDRDFVEQGEHFHIRGTIEGERSVQDALSFRAIDPNGRILWQKEVSPDSEGNANVEVVAAAHWPLWVRVEALCIRGGQEVAVDEADVKVSHRNREGFNMIMWDCADDVLGYYANRSLREAGFNISLRTFAPPYTVAAQDWAQIPYTTFIRDKYDKDGRMEPFSWNDEDAISKHIQEIVEKYRPSREHGVFAYSLGDEGTTLGASTDPSDMRVFREWLADEYGDIAALNTSWRSAYASFDEVDLLGYDTYEGETLALQDGVLKQGLTARWFDRQAFARHNFLNLAGRFGRAFKQMDPKAITGFEGSGGFFDDVEGIVTTNGFWNPYPGPADEILRSLVAPDYPRSYWIGYQKGDVPVIGHAMRMVSNGSTALFWWRWDDSIPFFNGYIGPDFDLHPMTRKLTDALRPIRFGVGAWYMGAERQHDGIAILHSVAAALAPRVIEGKTERACEAAHRGLQAVLEDLGLQYNYVTEKRIMNGILDPAVYKVLWLPETHALNPEAAAEIREFTNQGGVVLADTMPGNFDHHLAPLPEPDLADLFGGKQGRLFEHDLARYDPRRDEKPDGRDEASGAQLREYLKVLLTDVGIECPVSMEGSDGPLPPRIEMVRWKRADNEMIGVFHYPAVFRDRPEWPPPAKVRLSWDEPRAVHVIQEKAIPDKTRVKGIDLEVPVGRAKFVILSPAPLSPVKLSADKAVKQGDTISVTLHMKNTSARPVWFRGWAPDGEEAMWISRAMVVEDGKASIDIPVAHNEQPGTWKLQATDWFSGAMVEAGYEVR
jgi:hypothetical protein